MDVVLLYREALMGKAQLDVLDHHFSYAAGVFAPTPAFAAIQPVFDQSPAGIYWADLTGEFTEQEQDFCQARDALQLQFQHPAGILFPIRLVTIQFHAAEQRWKLVIHADREEDFHHLASMHYIDASEMFAQYTRLWQEAPVDSLRAGSVVARACEILARTTKNNPVLIGEPGASRRVLLAAVIAAIQDGAVADLVGWRMVELDVARITAAPNQRLRDHRLYAAIWYAYSQTPRSLFVIEHVDQLVCWAAPLLKPFLARRQMRVIGTATLADYRHDIERDAAIQRRMQEILIPSAM